MKSTQKGVGLPEIMVSLFLASLIMTGLIQHYISTKQHYAYLESVLDDATELQLAIDYLRNSIHQAGFTPCLSINQLITMDNRGAHEPLTSIILRQGTQPILQINRMSVNFDTIISLTSATEILASLTTSLHPKQPLVIADCHHAEVHTIREISHTKMRQFITLNSPLVYQYEEPIYIGEWVEEQFFVRNPGGLFYYHRHTDELTTHVNSMLPTVEDTANGLVVHVILELDHERSLHIDTRVRAG